MTGTELNKYRMILNTKEAELVRAIAKRDGIAIERTADALDEVQLAAQRELTTRGLERESTLLRKVRGALDRVAEGVYGTCMDCEEEISQKRLHAVPWATLCISCQERADGSSPRGFARHDRFLLDAA